MSAPQVALSRPAELALRLGVGALLLVAAAWLFGAVAEDVATSDHLTLVDVQVARWLREHATPALTRWMLLITNLHSTIAVSCYAAVVATALAWRRQWRRLATVFVCVAGGLTLNVLMKLAFHRARPVLDDPLLTLTSYSFPSGHVAGSTLAYGLLVAWVFGRTQRLRWRVLAVAGGAVAIALVAFTRMYLGVHYLSDVVAAFAEGVAWLALCLSALAVFWARAPMPPTTKAAEPANPRHELTRP
ncbi:MAG: phosphatase PAP2 family protein [Pseudomonadota bacterium]|nr:phosphatase PAP2 family protein [Pseudomonadota bacterium]